ncbi:MAG: amidophosphoribosyltransferase, partial [Candidatus Dadabacteria bacterium]|nr:amidophosphoribosyltransferase [Candidatus Dadabacteria bacterium]
KLREECGVFGIYDHPEAANFTYLGLYSLQHRGQESAGIVSTDGEKLYSHREMGLVTEVFDGESISSLQGTTAIGHVRYSTTGSSNNKNTQPLIMNYEKGELAVGHNGNLTNAKTLRHKLEKEGSIFQSTTDTEVIVHLIARSKEKTFLKRIIEALTQCKGAYSLVFLTPKGLVAARDPHGFRPLVLGKIDNSYVVASETCAFELIGANYIREIEPGEIVFINESGIRSFKSLPKKQHKYCVFENIYFSRPDSFVQGRNIYQMRKSMGKQLAIESPANADIVVAVPDSGTPAAMGYAEQLGIPFETGFLRSHYIGRTFIEPQQSIRNFGVKLKLSVIKEVIDGKKVVVVDDSIVRGTTSRKIVKMIRDAGAKEVHMRISSPPMKFSCYYGIDTPLKEELIAHSLEVEKIKDYITSDTLGYLSKEGITKAVTNGDKSFNERSNYCFACFDGNYPVEITDEKVSHQQMDLF